MFSQAFRNHQQHHPLSEPGTADLTADVDFNFLKEQVKEKLITFGPVNQATFLTNMGIETRLSVSLVIYFSSITSHYKNRAKALSPSYPLWCYNLVLPQQRFCHFATWFFICFIFYFIYFLLLFLFIFSINGVCLKDVVNHWIWLFNGVLFQTYRTWWSSVSLMIWRASYQAIEC